LATSNNQADKDDIGGRIAKEGGKQVKRTAGYDNNEDALRWQFGSDTELDELEAAGGLVHIGGGQGRHELR